MSSNFFSDRSKLLRFIFFFVVITFFIFLLIGFKKFIVWNQIVDHYKNELLDVSENFYCNTKNELTERSGEGLFKLGFVKTESITAPCVVVRDESLDNENIDLYNLDDKKDQFSDKGQKSVSIGSLSHVVRLKLLYPVIMLGALTETNIHTIYTIFCTFILFFTAFLLATNTLQISLNRFYFFSIVLLVISIFMNGRNLLSYLSISLLLYATAIDGLDSKGKVLLFLTSICAAFVFSNVSSGVNLYILIFFCVWSLFNFNFLVKLSFISKLFLFLATLIQTFWVIVGVTKNVSYYGGNILTAPWLMLNHGFGKYVFSYYGGIAILSFYLFYRRNTEKFHRFSVYLKHLTSPLALGMIISLSTGMFGYSILSMSLIFIMIFIGIYIDKALLNETSVV